MVQNAKATTTFSSLFKGWSYDFWALIHFLKTENEDFQEDFLDVSHSLRRQYLRSRLLRNPWDKDEIPKKFFELWRTKLRTLSKRNSIGLNSGSEENNFLEQSLLFSLSQNVWSLDQISMWTGIPVDTLKKRAFHSLLKFTNLNSKTLKYLDRNCVKNDLFWVDYKMKTKWKDPLALYSILDFEKHFKSCERCRQVNQAVELSLAKLSKQNKAVQTKDFSEYLNREMSSKLKVISMDALTVWPWYLKTPVQMAVMAFVLFSIMSIPYIGDFFPEYTHSQKKVSQIVSNTGDTLVRFFVKTLESARNFRTEMVVKWENVRHKQGADISDEPFVNLSKEKIEPQVIAQTEVPIATMPPVPTRALAPTPVENRDPIPTEPVIPESAKVTSTPVPSAVAVPAPAPIAENATPQVNTKVFYRWGAFSRDLKAQTDFILLILTKYNAIKAGDLDLGASYKGGTYFHFSVREENFADLVSEIKKVGLTDFTQSTAKSDKETKKGFKRVVFLLFPQE